MLVKWLSDNLFTVFISLLYLCKMVCFGDKKRFCIHYRHCSNGLSKRTIFYAVISLDKQKLLHCKGTSSAWSLVHGL
mgnify:CR=1 FL=1